MKRAWNKLKIGKKLIIAFLLIAILSGSSGIIGVGLMKSSDTKYSDALVNYGFSQGDIGLLMEALTANSKNVITTMATNDSEIIAQAQADIEENSAKISEYMESVEKTLIGDEEQGYYDTISENLPQFTEHALKVLELAAANKNDEAMELYQAEALEHIEAIEDAASALMNINKTTGTQLSDKLSTQSQTAIWIMVIISAVSWTISVILGIFIASSISKPMAACSRRLVLLSEGDLNTDIPVVQSQDETGILADATGELVDRLKVLISQMTEILGSMADGNLNVDYTKEFSGDFAPLHDSSSKIIDSLNEAFRQIGQSADQVNVGSDQVAASAQALSQGATEQASSVQELAASISEISRHVNKNAENAQQARKETEKQSISLTNGNQKMEEMVQAMAHINDRSNEIGKIIKTIEDIAFQTNILALNAAVEAARAGAAGKGFAVVADEVRNLAGKSSEAAKNTTVLIEETIRAVENGTTIADATAEAMREVVTSSHVVTELVDLIAKASDEQAQSISQVTSGVEQISSVVQTNSATAEESAAASEELAGQAQMMKQMLSRFRLK